MMTNVRFITTSLTTGWMAGISWNIIRGDEHCTAFILSTFYSFSNRHVEGESMISCQILSVNKMIPLIHPGVEYLFLWGQLSQEFVNIFKWVPFLQPIKDIGDLLLVLQHPRAQGQLCHLGWGKQWQCLLLQNNNEKEHWSLWAASTAMKSSRWWRTQSVKWLTLEKLALRVCRSCRVAKAEKLPKFFWSQSLLPLVLETQPGSATTKYCRVNEQPPRNGMRT